MSIDWQTATVVSVTQQTPGFKTLILKPQRLLPFKSGNFVEIGVEKDGANKCYSIVNSPNDNSKTFEIGVKLFSNGELSPKLFRLKVGDEVFLRGPQGAYFIWEVSSKTTIVIAGGSGICPMISILRQFDPKVGELFLLFSTKHDSIYYKNELEEKCREKKVNYSLVQTGKEGRVNKEYLENKYGKLIGVNTDFYVAGPTEFVQDVSLWLRELGVAENNIKTDDFGAD